MARKLFFSEKPSQACSISTLLNATRKREGHFEGGVVSTWAFGHLLAEAEPADYVVVQK
jgi:DNA topoisomerase-3